MSDFRTRTYTFNHPLAALLLIPLVLIEVLLVVGLSNEFNFIALLMLILTAILIVVIAGYGFLRTVRFYPDDVLLKGLKRQYVIPKIEVTRYGVVKYRAFRFIYLSRATSGPFNPDQPQINPTEDTIVLQYRKNAWNTLLEWLGENPSATREDHHFRN